MKKSFTAKLWKIMSVCAAQAVLAITLCGVTFSHPNYAQLLDKEVTLHVTDLPFETALKELEKVAWVQFAYSIDQLEDEPNVSLSIEKQTLRHALETLLTTREIQYRVHERDGVITLKKTGTSDAIDPPSDRGQGRMHSTEVLLMQISGNVTDESTGAPMAGVSVLVKGTTNGTTTDAEGRYTVSAEESDILVFSFIGYTSVEVPVSSRTVIDITMAQDVTSLGEVVVNAGYWEVKDRERTGNISRVSAKEIENQPVQNPMAAIQGRMAGVYITEDSGTPGSGFRIQIRGRNSLREDGNDPLYVIDGVPYQSNSLLQQNPTGMLSKPSPLSIINPSDIQSIEVLKDADATAIYGSRGANGVVLITTRKGTTGQTHVGLDFQSGIGDVANRIDLLNTQQYLEMRTEAFANDNRVPTSTDYDLNGVWDKDRYTDWQDVLYGETARFNTAQLTVSGGSGGTRFLFAGSFNNQTTVHPGDMDYSRTSVHLAVNHVSANGKLDVNLTTTGGLEDNDLSPVRFFDVIYTLPPNAPSVYTDDGRINWQNGSWNNPIADLGNDYQANTFNSISSFNVGYEILNGLTIKSNLGYNTTFVRELTLSPIRSKNPSLSGLTGSASFITSKGSTWIAEPQVEYNLRNGRGVLTALGGASFQENTVETLGVNTAGVENDELLHSVAAAPTGGVSAMNSYGQYRYAALFGRLHYDFDGRYILNLTGRRDGSSRFGPRRQYANFGAAGFAWIMSKERFFSIPTSFISFAKLRASYGITGNDQIGDYGYLDTYSNVDAWQQYEGSPTLIPSRLANRDYGWESNMKIEMGLELHFLSDRITLASSYYRNRSSNQLVGLPLPATTGFSTIQYNLPATVQNTGWEFDVLSNNIQSDRIVWTTSVNLSIPRNRLISYPNLATSPNAKRYMVGKPIEGFAYTYNYAGVDPETGVYLFRDLDESGSITAADEIAPFVRELRYYGGIVNSVVFHGFEFEVMLYFTDRTGSSYRTSFSTPGTIGPQPVEVMKRWQANDDVATIQKFASRPSGNIHTAHTRWKSSDENIDDLSFLRLKNVSISWRLPEKFVSKLGAMQGSVYVQGRNLLTVTSFKGLDPESRVGVPLRTVIAGIQVTF